MRDKNTQPDLKAFAVMLCEISYQVGPRSPITGPHGRQPSVAWRLSLYGTATAGLFF